jgi:hypothetical protein
LINQYTASQKGASVLQVTFPGIAAGWEQWLLLSSDRHHDNKMCDRKLEKQHLDLAAERDALIFDFGDLFCAMQGKYDPRSDMAEIRPEDVSPKYLDKIVEHAAADYAPYKDNWLLMGEGNHETNITHRHGTGLISNLVHRMNTVYGAHVYQGGYGGWVQFFFQIHGTKRQSLRLKYHHGAGGGGPVTRGVIQTNRQAVYLPDADIVVNGHTHDGWYVAIARERLNQAGVVSRDLVHFIRTPGYKDEYAGGDRGFIIERWGAPKPLGCFWARLYLNGDRVDVEFTPAMT